MRKIILFVLAVFFASSVLAVPIDFEVIRVTLDERGDAFVQHFVGFDSASQSSLSVNILGNTTLRVFDAEGNLDYTENNGLLTITPRSNETNYSFTVEYFTSSLTSKIGQEWTAMLDFEHLNESTQGLKIEVVLPRNVSVIDMEPKGILFSADTGLEIEWSFAGNAPIVKSSVVYSLHGNGNNSNSFDYGLIGWVILALLGIGAVGYYFSIHKRKKSPLPKTEEKKGLIPGGGAILKEPGQPSTKQEGMLKLLSDNERRIMDELMATNSVSQRTVQVKLGLPKSTLSRTIKKLELKGLVKSLEIGNSKRLELGEEFTKAGQE